ncbi:trigger factor [Sulfidibacter corallicola]|uniref:Trigger factor n=1 Tax=Sulfidibacter corallicola TaxID=2818388 RepID=A0A8A4TTF7_SULCO|nr:trigger factor [Sulfidibacter corallicola]QTD52773.1 trigger factor [Sulfidibacter corallicola]
MQINITEKSPILVSVEVTLPWDKVSSHFSATFKEITKYANLPGFRKGKAPTAILLKRYRSEIISDLAQRVVPETMKDVIKEKDLRAAGQPRLADADLKHKESFGFTAVIEVLPEIELKDWKGVEVESLNVSATDEMVNEKLEGFVKSATKHQDITDRAAEDGDEVTVALTAIDGETDETVTDIEKYVVYLGKEHTHPFLADMVKGANLGDTVEDEFEGPEDDAFKEWQGKKVRLYVDIEKIQRHEAPELDDTFAKNLGHEDLAAFRAKTREEILEQLEEDEKNSTEMRLMSKILDDYEFEVPPSAVYGEAEMMVRQQVMPYMQYLGDSPDMQKMLEGMMSRFVPSAAQKVRTDVFLDAVTAELDLTVAEEELNEELQDYLNQTQEEEKSLEELREELEGRGDLRFLEQVILRRKALDAVVGEAKIVKVDELTKEPEPEPEHEHGPDCDHAHGSEEAETKVEASGDDATSSEAEVSSEA